MDEKGILNYHLPYLKKIRPDFERNWVLDIAVTKERNIETLHSLHYSSLIPEFKTPIPGLYLLCPAQFYPEPTVLDASVRYAHILVNKFFN